MPASGLTWSPSKPDTERGSVFQVFGQFGTKRKADEEETEQSWDMETGQHVQQQSFMSAKRFCSHAEAPQMQPLHQSSHSEVEMGVMMNPNSTPAQNGGAGDGMGWLQRARQTSHQHPQSAEQFPNAVPRPDITDNNFSYKHNAAQLSETCAQEMESDMDMAAMDSDFTPDPEQYTALPAATAAVEVHPNTPPSVGYTSSESSRVRCFCKPSWEGIMSMRPYVSDIY